jgi:Sec-independent protein translocase protein TatA
MFGIGIGEILLILFIVFIISPKDIPKLMRKIGQFFGAIDKLRGEIADIEKEVREVAAEVKETGRTAPKRSGVKKGKPKKKV